MVKAIKGYSGGWDILDNIASLKKCVEVGSQACMDEGDIPFVRVSNLSPFEITEEKYISESFNLRRQSKHLLKCARRAVEIAIEQNEDTAGKWLKEQTEEAVS